MRAADTGDGETRFARIARDPRIVPDLHRMCDEWCEQCALTDRCLAFQCRKQFCRERGLRASGSHLPTAGDAIAFHRQLFRVDPALRGTDVALQPRGIDAAADDRLAAAALDYVTRSAGFVARQSTPAIPATPIASPAPGETVLRFHSAIYFKTMRALVGRALAAGSMTARLADAEAYAAQVLACAARSRDALARYPAGQERDQLVHRLDEIARQIGQRFPAAIAWRQRWPHAPHRRTIDSPGGQEYEI